MILLQSNFQLTLGTPQLLLFGIAGLAAGYLLKLVIEKYFLKSKDERQIAQQFQENIDALQNKFSAEIIKKEEETRQLQDELKDADDKNYNIQLQYSKALKQIESHRESAPQGSAAGAYQQDQGTVYEDILQTLHERIAIQETTIQQLREETVLAENSSSGYNNGAVNNLPEELQQQISVLLAENEQAKQDAGMLKEQHNALQEKLLHTGRTHEEEIAALQTVFANKLADAEARAEQYKLQTEDLRNNMYALDENVKNSSNGGVENIKILRSDVERMNDVINNFKEHLSSTLETSYPYEQAIAENETLKEKLRILHEDKIKMDENISGELLSIKTEKTELEAKCADMTQEMMHAQRLVEQLEDERNTAVLSLQALSKEKENALHELELTTNKLRKNIELLHEDLHQKENFLQEVSAREGKYKEMFYAVKDLESQFLSLYPQLDKTEEATFTVNNNGQIR